ncbi:hypothetical protein MMYC01_202548 [Madurella mycetomatis]|uniref:Rhodopsin domain-containing protein n=1 Tax=Madurella mycetomatis TaxID=100816 RepID=A0A175W8C2_9PEZI|nr:hypothetical protein MMYC01_202548 [Madurella mycetomatis]
MLEYVEFPVLPIVKAHLVINCIVALLTTATVGLRVVARFLSGAGLWWDDYLILCALPQGIGMLIIQGLWAPMGVGYPINETMPNLPHILRMLISYELIYVVCISTVKLSVMVFYLRVFVNKGLRLATKIALAFVCLWSVGNLLQVFLLCRPFARSYDPTIPGECGDQVASFIAIGSFNIITDIVILGLPLPTVWSLKMTTAAKLGLTGVFLVGLIVSVIAIIRIVALAQLDMTNLTGTMIWADFWSTTEPLLAIMCVSMPMLRSLRARCASRRGTSKSSQYYHSDGNPASGSAFSKLKNQSNLDKPISLESIYASNQEVHHQSAVATAATPEPDQDRPGPIGSDSGSEVALTTEQEKGRQNISGIRVHTKWTISHN